MRRQRRGRMHLNADINVVSLIDVMLVLLVIFMLTAPMMTGGIDVSLPVADAKPLESKGGVAITIAQNGTIYLNDTPMRNFAAYQAALPLMVKGKEKEGVRVYVDKRQPSEILVQVLAVVMANGITNVGFPTVPEEHIR
jgi:biopolymer transport protein TolR